MRIRFASTCIIAFLAIPSVMGRDPTAFNRRALAARGESPADRVASAVGPDARRADRGDVGSSSRRRYTADEPTPPQPEGRQGSAATGQRYSSSPMPPHRLLPRALPAAADPWRTTPRDFHHGLLGSGFTGGLLKSGLLGTPWGRRLPVRTSFTRVPRGLTTFFFRDRLLVRPTDRPQARFFPGAFHTGVWGVRTPHVSGPSNYLSHRFVDQWKDRKPAPALQSAHPVQSLLLSEGMSEEEVVRRIGMPIERTRSVERELWQYSGYALVFEVGRLRGIR